MIFVTVGMHYLGFERLIKKMDEIAGKIDEEVIMQIGSTKYEPTNARYFRFVDSDEEMLKLYEKARVIVSHGGAGTLLTAFNYNKPIIVVPRLKKYGEHVDDQQIELVQALSKERKIIPIYDVDCLGVALERATTKLESSKIATSRQLIKFIRDSINQ